MSNPKNLNPILKSLKEDIQLIGTYMRDFSFQVIDQGISKYPVYIASHEVPTLGRPFFDIEQHRLNWNYNASILEEFVKKGIVAEDKTEDFIATYGDPSERACVLIILENEISFLFVPFDGEEE